MSIAVAGNPTASEVEAQPVGEGRQIRAFFSAQMHDIASFPDRAGASILIGPD